MSKPTGISHSTLSWVKKELDETLRQAAESLEIYSQDPSDPTHLQFCGSHLHQVHGILQMLELFGAAMLVEEMEQVANALLRGEARQVADAQQALMQAILQLGDYLERVQAGLQDVPILLLPLLNDLRAVRNASLLTEHALFSPDLKAAAAGRPRSRATAAEPLTAAARRLRSQYQRGLLGVLREKNLQASLAQMAAALEGLEAASADAAVGDMWWIASALVEALQHGTAESAAAIKMLLAQIDREIRRAIDVGEAGLVAEPRQELVKNLLYYVARAQPQSERVAAVQERYGLKRLLLDEHQLETARRGIAAPNADTLQAVASILKEDLITAKDSLDLYARSGYTDQDRLPPLAEGLGRVADTLGVLGLGVPRRVIKEQVARINALANGSVTADEARVMEIAEALLYVESAIDGFSAGVTIGTEQDDDLPEADYGSSLRQLSDAEYHEIYGTAIGEVVADVARLKETVAKLIEAGSAEGIGDTVQRFEELAATLRLLDKADVADLLSAVGSYVAANLLPGRSLPDPADLDTFADALAGIEYYLEAARDGHAHPASVLEKVSAALAKLDSTPAAEPVSELSWFEPGSDSEASDDFTVDFDLAEAAIELQESHDEVEGFTLDEALTAPADSLELASLEFEPLEPTPAPVAPVPVAVQPTKKSGRINYDAPVLADAIDDDILEIFIEEAGEVLETLREEYPRWRSDPENTAALTTVRRMYHTLKGSGRLAGALLLGEMAWSLESLLNRVLERAIAAGPEVYSVVEDSIAVLPALLDQIQGQPVSGLDVIGLMQRADALANPNSPDGPEGGGPAKPKPALADSSAALAESSAPVEPAMEEPLASFDEPLEFPLVEEIVLEAPAAAPLEADLPEFALEDFGLPAAEPDWFEAPSELVEEIILEAQTAEPAAADPPGFVLADFELPVAEASWPETPRELDEIVLSEEPLNLAAAEFSFEGLSVEFDLDEQPIEIMAEPAPVEPVVEAGGMDPILYDIFSRETADHLAVVRAFIDSGRQSGQPVPATKALVRALHTLTGSARMADVGPIAHIGRKLEVLAEHHVLSGRPVGSAELDLMERGGELVEDMVRSLALPAPEWPDIEPLLGEIDAATQALAEVVAAASNHVGMEFPLLEEEAEVAVAEADPVPAEMVVAEPESAPAPATADIGHELSALFLEEAEDILRFLEMTVQRWEEELDHTATVAELHRSLHTLKGGARLAGFTAIGTLCHALESVAVDVADHRVPADDIFFNLLHACVDRLVSMTAEAKGGALPQTPDDLLAAIAELRGSTELVEEQLGDLADAELVEVFLEEAADILEATEAALNHWQNEPGNEERIIDLQRALHTLKGGARMAGFKPIADLSHALETLLVGVQSGRPQPSAELFDLLERIYDRLFSMRAKAAFGEPLTDADDLLAAIAALRDGTPTAAQPPVDEPVVTEPAAERPLLASAAAALPAETLQTQAPQAKPAATPVAAPSEPPQQARDDGADAVRVRADLLDDMVNFAGEVSIYRARLEQQVGGMRFNLGELDQTVARLREQLRTLEIETEAQILYRFDREYETAGADAGPEDFDPLELDRFSRMQELSRALSES
ncbi:MAG TPA: Hpt domain-containing protein, partial [Gammaproteobacteria bacterium]|nr:Hpt domain-containing protein [Gammaproteobacteria bacterium]